MYNLRLNFVARALTGVETLPASERAGHYDLAAAVLASAGHEITDAAAEAARTHAKDLREAEASQLHFRALLPLTQA